MYRHWFGFGIAFGLLATDWILLNLWVFMGLELVGEVLVIMALVGMLLGWRLFVKYWLLLNE